MKLMTQEIKKQLPALYSQDNVEDPIAKIKYFCPWNQWTWFAIEYDGENMFFGKVVGHETELGYFSLSELESVTGPLGLKIERDLYFKPTPLSQCK